MPIYMIMHRYSHNYAQFCQLLNSNLFSHHRILMLLRDATSETYAPRVYLLSYKLSIYFYLHLYFLHLYYKIPKIYLSYHIISIRSHFPKWPWRDWQPLYCVGCEDLFVCATCEEPPTGLIPWFSKTEANTYATIVASSFPLQGKPTQAQDVAICRCRHHQPSSITNFMMLTTVRE